MGRHMLQVGTCYPAENPSGMPAPRQGRTQSPLLGKRQVHPRRNPPQHTGSPPRVLSHRPPGVYKSGNQSNAVPPQRSGSGTPTPDA
ncbi:MAG: hypothetical protein KME49_06945 [Brasilonema octagenarum HA4186-MV1]|uniref:hypothetical protein n=1 Tax=Brasilonema TaxID=383614 RepID=UPI00145EF5EE|nr:MULTISPECIES: hypothetical protein [Brasilonema]MBW4625233.1 hypothetical protein [Brasilonema octagenarum HA4186-MV1]